jgi:hypothetical protein
MVQLLRQAALTPEAPSGVGPVEALPTVIAARRWWRSEWLVSRPGRSTLLLIVAVATSIRLVLVKAGLPNINHPDEPTNLRVGLSMTAHHTALPHWYHYPSMLFDVIAGVLFVSGHSGHAGTAKFLRLQTLGNSQTTAMHTVLALRLVTVALSVGMCVIVALVVRRLTASWIAALVAGLVLALSPVAVENGVAITPDTYSGFFAALALAGALRVADTGTTRGYLLTGAAVGAAVASKYNAILVILSLLAAHFVYYGRASTAWRATRKLLASIGMSAVVFVVITPGAVLDRHRLVRDVNFELKHYAQGHAGADRHSGRFYLDTLVHSELALLVLAVVGLVAVIAAKYRRPVLVVGFFAVPYFALLSSEDVHFSRNLLPLLPALGILAGLGTAQVVRAVAAADPKGRWLLGAVALGAVAVVLVGFIRQTVTLRENLYQPARAEARSWLAAHVPVSGVVENEDYGPYLDGPYRLIRVRDSLGAFPTGVSAVIVTELADGRFIDDPSRWPEQVAAYNKLKATSCLAAEFRDGPWIKIFVPCPSR